VSFYLTLPPQVGTTLGRRDIRYPMYKHLLSRSSRWRRRYLIDQANRISSDGDEVDEHDQVDSGLVSCDVKGTFEDTRDL
jgi:hypothetical protein